MTTTENSVVSTEMLFVDGGKLINIEVASNPTYAFMTLAEIRKKISAYRKDTNPTLKGLKRRELSLILAKLEAQAAASAAVSGVTMQDKAPKVKDTKPEEKPAPKPAEKEFVVDVVPDAERTKLKTKSQNQIDYSMKMNNLTQLNKSQKKFPGFPSQYFDRKVLEIIDLPSAEFKKKFFPMVARFIEQFDLDPYDE